MTARARPPRRAEGRSRRRLAALVVAGSVGVWATAGCAGVRNNLGTNAGVCFRDLPEAKQAVGKGELVGVRRVATARLRAHAPNDPGLARTTSKELCVLAFRGTYQPGSVPAATNASSGHYAVVAAEVTRPTIVSVLVLDTLPTRFRHLR